ncbi:haloalkane dehalogenase-like [Sycon ciliatum]|uniref:haloalkane dehalogenase-like n=1 Tax=Sycon ciliatum TaxID=27933 RepID=UPI0031F639E5
MALSGLLSRKALSASLLTKRLPCRVLVATMASRSQSSKSGTERPIATRWNEDLFVQKPSEIFGKKIMHYEYEQKDGFPKVVFLHGNPTSSYLWRNILPHLTDLRIRMLAPDLYGMGDSAKTLDENYQYRFMQHVEYLDEWFRQQGLDKCNDVILVLHDWGSALGFHWANRHRDCVKAIVHMESLVHAPIPWSTFPEEGRKVFQLLRSDAGEEMIYEKNFFVERLLPNSILRKLSFDEMRQYRRPFELDLQRFRRPTLTWPREIPIEGEGPEDVEEVIKSYASWLAEAPLPKLFIGADPGYFTKACLKAMRDWPNQKVVSVPGLHFLQEDSPHEIGEHIKEFVTDLVQVPSKL